MCCLNSKFGDAGRLVKSLEREKCTRTHAENTSRERAMGTETLGVIQCFEAGVEAPARQLSW